MSDMGDDEREGFIRLGAEFASSDVQFLLRRLDEAREAILQTEAAVTDSEVFLLMRLEAVGADLFVAQEEIARLKVRLAAALAPLPVLQHDRDGEANICVMPDVVFGSVAEPAPKHAPFPAWALPRDEE